MIVVILLHQWSRLTAQIRPICSNITTHSLTVRQQKGSKCSPPRQVSLETTAIEPSSSFFSFLLPQSDLTEFFPLLFLSSFYSLTLFTLVRPPPLFPFLLPLSCFALTSLVSGLFFLNNLPSLCVAPLDFAVPLPV